eukprot:260813-Amphidinium_carterae.1
MDPFKTLLEPLLLPWERGLGAAVPSPAAATDDIASLRLLKEIEIEQITGLKRTVDALSSHKGYEGSVQSPEVPIDLPTMEEADEQVRTEMLEVLVDWLLSSPQWSVLGSQLAECNGVKERMQTISDAFADRATGTLKLRVVSLRLFERWSGAKFPLSEQAAYAYVSHLRETKAPPSRAKMFVEAAVLLAAVAQAGDLEGLVKSARLKGAAYRQLSHKSMRRQRSPLTLRQVVALEKLMERKAVGPELVALGHVLFVLHTCSRWSDTLSLVEPPKLDDVLVEAEAKRTKVTKGLKRLRVPVPLLGMATGVSNTPWATIWISAREA